MEAFRPLFLHSFRHGLLFRVATLSLSNHAFDRIPLLGKKMNGKREKTGEETHQALPTIKTEFRAIASSY
jgi:hypothetical protein